MSSLQNSNVDHPFDESNNSRDSGSNGNGNSNSSYPYGSIASSTTTNTITNISRPHHASPINITTADHSGTTSGNADDVETQDLLMSDFCHQQKQQLHQHRNAVYYKRIRLYFMYGALGIVVGMILVGIYIVFYSAARVQRLKHATPEKQLEYLNKLTNKVWIMMEKLDNNEAEGSSSQDFVRNMKHGCSTRMILLRHCEKTLYDEKGKIIEDEIGDHHCSPIGYEHAEYISTLFDTKQKNDNHGERILTIGKKDDGNQKQEQPHGGRHYEQKELITHQESASSSTKKYSSPLLLYAMNPRRPGVTDHRTYRQTETLTPLSEKAGIPINTQFTDGHGLYLADDYFQHYLSQGKLCPNVGFNNATLTVPTTTVVSWKHTDMVNLARALGCSEHNGCPSKNYDADDFDQIWELHYQYHLYDDDSNDEHRKLDKDNGKKPNIKNKHHSTKHDGIGYWTLQGTVRHGGFHPSKAKPSPP